MQFKNPVIYAQSALWPLEAVITNCPRQEFQPAEVAKNHGWANRVTSAAKTLPLNAKNTFVAPPPYLLHSSVSERCTHPPSTVSNFFLAAAIADGSRHGTCCYSCCCGGGDHFGSAIARYSQNGCIKGQSFAKKWVYQGGNFFQKNGCIISHNSMPKLTPQLSERIPFLFLFGASVSEKKAAWNSIRLVGMCLSNVDDVVCQRTVFFDTSSSSPPPSRQFETHASL